MYPAPDCVAALSPSVEPDSVRFTFTTAFSNIMPTLFRHKTEETWESDNYIWLENTGDRHIMLRMASGDLRLDMGRKLRFRPDILELPQVKNLLEHDQLTVQE